MTEGFWRDVAHSIYTIAGWEIGRWLTRRDWTWAARQLQRKLQRIRKRISRMSASRSIIHLTDGRQVCLSYGVPVAAFIPGRGYVKTVKVYSKTSTAHANSFIARGTLAEPSAVLDESEFRALIAPVTCGGY